MVRNARSTSSCMPGIEISPRGTFAILYIFIAKTFHISSKVMVTHKSMCDGWEIHSGRGRIFYQKSLVQLSPFAVHVAVILREGRKNRCTDKHIQVYVVLLPVLALRASAWLL